jgi:hypothetical protein
VLVIVGAVRLWERWPQAEALRLILRASIPLNDEIMRTFQD